ncbi:MAG: hypothetical protein Q8O56_07220, partial [Solirubrobacteraceae bacterium]|nr:hypothetical protein [Solirubrobacteraceae bacterium]
MRNLLLAVAASALAALVLAPAARAAAATVDPATGAAGPSLRIVTADLRQLGADLQLRLRFSRGVPVTEIDSAKGRFACLVLGPLAPTRRRVCVSRAAGRLRATMT